MKLSVLIKKSVLWWRVIKLSMLATPMIWVTALELQARERPHLQGRTGIKELKGKLWYFIRLFRHQFLNKYFLNSKCVVVNYQDWRAIGTSLDGIVAFAWVCEKMKIDVNIKNCMVWKHFENDKLINTQDESTHKFQPAMQKKFFHNDVAWFGTFFISSTYGHKILSKLAINQNLKRCANQWSADNIKGDWVAIHYRGTDASNRNRVDMDSYIVYLKEVIGNQCSIFACSDQAQFIDKMHIAFPSRVFSRDIERSYNEYCIHRHGTVKPEIDSFNQEKDALIDLLVLAKAKLIYTTGSGFVDVARYFNPHIKIISLKQRKVGQGKNNMPMPRMDLYERLRS